MTINTEHLPFSTIGMHRNPETRVKLLAGRENGPAPLLSSRIPPAEQPRRMGRTAMWKPKNETWRAEIEAKVASASSLVVYVGLDGTLAADGGKAGLPVLPAETRTALEDLSTRSGVLVALLSGHPLAELRDHVAIPSLVYVGDHGIEIQGASLRFEHPEAGRRRAGLENLNQRLTAVPLLFPGVRVGARALATTIHFGGADEASRDQIKIIVDNLVPESHPDFVVSEGKQCYEIRPRLEWNKGSAVRWIRERIKATDVLPVVVGDDPTEEDAYVTLGDAISIRAGSGLPGPTTARYSLSGQGSVGDVIAWLLDLWKTRPGARDDAGDSGTHRSEPGLGIKETSPIHSVRVRRTAAIRKRLESQKDHTSR